MQEQNKHNKDCIKCKDNFIWFPGHTHGDLEHDHLPSENATPLEELLVMMKYLVKHNDAHAQEVADLAQNLMAAGKDYLQHVHIASRGRRIMPGEDGELDNYVEGFRALKQLEYPHYVSFECGTKGEREQTVKAAVELIRAQWKLA